MVPSSPFVHRRALQVRADARRSLGKLLAKARRTKNLTCRQVAERIGLPKEKLGLVALVELRDEAVPMEMVASLCRVLSLHQGQVMRLVERSAEP